MGVKEYYPNSDKGIDMNEDYLVDKISQPENRKQYVRLFLAEALGTFVLVLFGDGAIAQVVLGNAARGDAFFGGFLNIGIGYGLALMIGISISGGVSGGHLNPAVSLAMLALRKLNPRQVVVYMAGQYAGAFLAALVLWGEYAEAINMVENISITSSSNSTSYTGATGGIFATYPFFGVSQISIMSLAMDQALGSAMLVVIILAMTDKNNMNIPSFMAPAMIGLGLTAIHLSLGLTAGCAVNPARDFSPRLLTLLAGWTAPGPLQAASHWFWIPLVVPHVGGVVGALMYQAMVGWGRV